MRSTTTHLGLKTSKQAHHNIFIQDTSYYSSHNKAWKTGSHLHNGGLSRKGTPCWLSKTHLGHEVHKYKPFQPQRWLGFLCTNLASKHPPCPEIAPSSVVVTPLMVRIQARWSQPKSHYASPDCTHWDYDCSVHSAHTQSQGNTKSKFWPCPSSIIQEKSRLKKVHEPLT